MAAQGSGGTAAEGNRDLAAGEVLPRAVRPEGKGRAAVNVDIARLATPPISVDRWPDVARIPSGPLSLVAAPIAGSPVPQCRGAPAAAHGLSRRHGRRRRRPDTADDGDSSPRRAGATDRPLRPDRFRRVLHGRRVELRRPGRCAHRVRAVDGRPHSAVACSGSGRSPLSANRVRSSTTANRLVRTSPSTTICPMSCSGSSSTRR